MSIDAHYKLRFSHESSAHLANARHYLRRKLRFYEHWSKEYSHAENRAEFLKRFGFTRENQFFGADYQFGKIAKCKHGFSMAVGVSCNEVSTNVWISGEDGELADLLDKFPALEISGHVRKEGGLPGQIIGYWRWNPGEEAFAAFMYTREAMSLVNQAALRRWNKEPEVADNAFELAFQRFEKRFNEFQSWLETRKPSLLLTGREPFDD